MLVLYYRVCRIMGRFVFKLVVFKNFKLLKFVKLLKKYILDKIVEDF